MQNPDLFSEWWPPAERRLRAALKPSRFKQDDLDDIVQRTAERAWLAKPFDDENHLGAWSIVVGRNIAIDEWRRSGREVVGDVPENVSGDDTADLVAAMIARDAMLDAISLLSPSQQAALAGLATSDSRTEAVRQAVQRHRIRKNLREVFEKFAPFIGGWRARIARVRLPLGSAETAAAVVAVAMAGLGIGALGQLPDSNEHAAPIPSRTATTPENTQVASATTVVQVAPPKPTSRPTPRSVPPIIRVPLGPDRNGNEYYIQARERLPEEEGLMLCIGELGDPTSLCLNWPRLVNELVKRLPLP